MEIACLVCGEGDDEGNLLVCKACGVRAMHLGCFAEPLVATPVDGYRCDRCETKQGSVEQEPPLKRRAVSRDVTTQDLIDFMGRVLSKTAEGINEALGLLKENVASLPTRLEYLDMGAEEQAEAERASLVHAYLLKSPAAKELLDELKEAFATSNVFMVLVELLHVVVHNNYFLKTIGSNFVVCRQIIRNEVPKMNALFETVKPGPTMASLLLLRTVASTSQSAATDLVGALNLGHFKELFSNGVSLPIQLKRAHLDLAANWDLPDDVRSFAARVVFALLRSADSRLKDFLLGRDEANARVVSQAYSRLTTYNRGTVMEALDVLRNCVLRDRSLLRRTKTAFFQNQLMHDLGMLVHRYYDARVIDFIEYAVTDHFNGIVIPEEVWMPDPAESAAAGGEDEESGAVREEQGKGEELMCWSSNNRLMALLNALRPWRSVVQCEMVLMVLRECPRLAPLYFGQDGDNFFWSRFFPNECSSSWLCVMALVKKYCEEHELPLPGPWSSDARARELAERTVPGSPSVLQWRKCLASDFALVRYVTLDVLCAVLTRCRSLLELRHPLVPKALDVIQKHRLPHCNLIQLLLAREKSEAKNAGSDMVLGMALRALNLYHAVFGESGISDANWVGSLQSPWSRVPAIRQIVFTSHSWWLRGPAKDVFKMLAAVRGSVDTLLREAVLETTESLLRDTDLFGNALFANELEEWLLAVESEADAEVLVSTVSRIMKAVPTAKHLDAKFNQELRRFASPLLLEVAAQLYSSGGKNGAAAVAPKALYLCRVVAGLAHHSDIPLRLLHELTAALASDAMLAGVTDGATMQQHLRATASFVEFLQRKGSAPLAALGLSDPQWVGATLEKGADLKSTDPAVVLGHAVSQPHSWVLKRVQVDDPSERLFRQAEFYIRQLPNLAEEAKAVCFRVMWAALERGEEVVPRALREQLLLDGAVIAACLESSEPCAILCLGECLVACETHKVVGAALLSSGRVARAATLLPYVRWSQIDPAVVNSVLQKLIEEKDLATAYQFVVSAWPGVATVATHWLDAFWQRAELGPLSAGAASMTVPAQETVVAAMNSLHVSLTLATAVLCWALLGIVEQPSSALLKHLVGHSSAKNWAVSALLALWAKLYPAEMLAVLRSASLASFVVPAMVMAGKAPEFVRWTTEAVEACMKGDLPVAWLQKWKDHVDPRVVSIAAAKSSSPLPGWPELISTSRIPYEEKLRLLLPGVSLAAPSPGSWEAIASCLLELKHVAEWDANDLTLQVLDVAVRFPSDAAFEALEKAVRDPRTDAGWVERACRQLLQRDEPPSAAAAGLILATVERRPNLCSRDLLGRVATLYSGTCSALDLALLKIVRHCQAAGFDLDAVGYLWGRPTAGSSFAGGAEYLFYEGALVKDDVLIASINNFPVGRLEGIEDKVLVEAVYDPCFLLPYFRLMLTKFESNCKRFADRGFLAYSLMACSSEHELVRRLAYSVIQGYWLQLEACQNFSWKPQIRLLVSSFKNAIVRPLQYVPSVVTVFLAHFALIVCQPAHFMYELINCVLLRRPVFDLGSVPLLRDAFLAKCDSATRRWFFQTLGHGVKRGVDLKLLQEFHVVELLQSFFHHVADYEERVLVLRILLQSTSHPRVARMVDQKFGLLGWISVSADEVLERSVACAIATNVVQAWGEQASFQTRQLGWTVGVTLLHRATLVPQAEDALHLLGACGGGQSSSEEVVRLIEKSVSFGVAVSGILVAVSAGRGVGADGIVAVLELWLDHAVSGDAVGRMLDWTWSTLTVGLLEDARLRVSLKRVMVRGLVANDARQLHRLGLLACAVANLRGLKGAFADAVERSNVPDMVRAVVQQL